MNGKDFSVDALFEAERRRPTPADAVRARLLSRVSSTVGLPDSVPESPGTTPHPPSVDGGRSTLARWLAGRGGTGVVALLVGGAMGAATHAALVRRDMQVVAVPMSVIVSAPFAPPLSSPAPLLPEPTSSAETSAPSVASAPVVPRSSSSPNIAPRDADLAEERGLLEMARTALARGQAADAIVALDRHASSFPRGRLAEEREVLAIQSLVELGRPIDARARAARFRHRFPSSILMPAVDAALESIP